jgi:mediator of RNA polymerase II transcription subunit 12
LQSHNVAIPRAVWFLRVFGANETVRILCYSSYLSNHPLLPQAGLRNKPSYNPTQYSVDWANVVTGYLKKQLADIALPSAPRAGLNIKQTFKGVLADADSRARWISRFTYWHVLFLSYLSYTLHGADVFFQSKAFANILLARLSG